jgi:hypothetical protein
MARMELSGGSLPPCMILDDTELERQRGFRMWREEKQEIAAARIFGGGRNEIVSGGARAFPSAFQSYKPDKQATRGFPFIKPKGNPNPGKAVTPVTSEGRPRAELQATETKGALIASVKAMFEDEDILQKAREIAEFGVKLEPLDSDSIKNTGLTDDDGDYVYAPCTPPLEPNEGTQ